MNRTHRWSVGSLSSKSVRLFYLGGPISLLNAACRAHAKCHYVFDELPCHAVAKKNIAFGEEISINYNGDQIGPLTDTKMILYCIAEDCEAEVCTL